ncbi:MAG: hypothetical protein SOT34_02100 [Candidatus Borkfalkiaceae bacterium]|nr:hypothetical protein [Christensenellaceae bacterium]
MKKNIAIAFLTVCAFVFGTLGVIRTEKPAEKAYAAETGVIASSTASKADGTLTDAEWEAMESYAMSGANEGSIRFATNGTNFFFRMTVKDSTNFSGKDKIAFTFTTNGKSHGQQGNFAPWLTGLGDTSFGNSIQTELRYDATYGGYIAVMGYNLGADMVRGGAIEFSVTFNDVTDDSQSWGDGVATSFTKTLYFGEKPQSPAQINLPDATENPTYVIPVVEAATESAWDAAEVYAMTKTGDQTIAGVVKMLVSGQTLYVRTMVYDATKNWNDNPFVSVSLLDKRGAFNGKYYDEVLGDNNGKIGWCHVVSGDFGDATLLNVKYENNIYVLNVAYAVGDLAKKGAHLTASFGHGDAAAETDGWADGLDSYASRLSLAERVYYIGEYSEKDANGEVDPVDPVEPDPEPTEGPENVGLGIVVTDITHVPTESDWAKATAYDLIPLHGNSTGATATVKIYSAASNLFFRLTVTDPTVHKINDGVYIYLGTEDYYYAARGNYDNWLAQTHNDFGNPSLQNVGVSVSDATSYAAGVYTFDLGYYVPQLYGEGNTFRLEVRHRDSRSSAEGWADADYFHTVYFNQVLTFGAPADTTTRPQEPTEGFAAGTEKVSYNKGNATWSEVEGAETYKIYVYKKNAEGEKESYTNVSVEGPIYSGDDTYSEVIMGLSAETEYAVQVVACDDNDEAFAWSELVSFRTLSKEEAESSSESSPEESSVGESSSLPTSAESVAQKNGCTGAVSSVGFLSLVVLGAGFALKKKKDNE